jgi:acrylyl-CoA reductase (NADPH)
MKKTECFYVERNKSNFDLVKKNVNLEQLKYGQVLVQISYSSINFRDDLALKGNPGVARRFPFAPGVDMSGIVLLSADIRYPIGVSVCAMAVNPLRVSPGAWSNYAIFWAEDLMLISADEAKGAAIIGTAGLAAASGMSFILENIGACYGKKILITGAVGGVGIIATIISKSRNLSVTSLVRDKGDERVKKLFEIGVDQVIDSVEFLQNNKMNMLREEYDAVFDVLGGSYFSTAAKRVRANGVMACAGLVESQSLSDLTLLPFILRGIALIGTGAENIAGPRKQRAITLVSELLRNSAIYSCYNEIKSEDLIYFIKNKNIKTAGRVIINFSGGV